jgi:peroxiredoxin
MAVLGLALVVLGYGSYLAMLFFLRRFTYRTRLFDAVVAVGTVLALVGLATGSGGPPAWIAIVLGLAWYPVTRRELTLVGSERLTLRVGDRLPGFTAALADGTPITEKDIVARAPALLVLYRGWWCPSTKVLLHEQLEDHDRLTAAGLTTFAASVDPPEMAVAMQDYVGDTITIVCSFPVAVLEAIGARDRRGAPWYDRLLLHAPKGDIAMPASLVVDSTGRIAYAFRARRVDEHARPREILASLHT